MTGKYPEVAGNVSHIWCWVLGGDIRVVSSGAPASLFAPLKALHRVN